VQRRTGREPYSDAELDLLNMIGRHVEKAFRLGTRLLDAEISSIGLSNALSEPGMRVIVLEDLFRHVPTKRRRACWAAVYLTGEK
jgi:hypothetical protein